MYSKGYNIAQHHFEASKREAHVKGLKQDKQARKQRRYFELGDAPEWWPPDAHWFEDMRGQSKWQPAPRTALQAGSSMKIHQV